MGCNAKNKNFIKEIIPQFCFLLRKKINKLFFAILYTVKSKTF